MVPNVKTLSSGSSVNTLCSWAGWRCWNIWTSWPNADWPDSPKRREWTEWRVWSSNLDSSSVCTSKLYTYLAENKKGWLLQVHTFMAQVWPASRTYMMCTRRNGLMKLFFCPGLLIADEPTTGLDSDSALDVLGAMKSIKGATNICTIHQPSSGLVTDKSQFLFSMHISHDWRASVFLALNRTTTRSWLLLLIEWLKWLFPNSEKL